MERSNDHLATTRLSPPLVLRGRVGVGAVRRVPDGLLALLALLALAASSARAEGIDAPPPALEGVGVTEKLNAQLPLDLSFTDDTGQIVKLRDLFAGRRPIVLQLGYYGCPMLCGLVSRGLVDAAKEIPLRVNSDYDVLYISIDPSETSKLAAMKKASYIAEYGHPESAPGWRFLVGDAKSIEQLTTAAGFGFRWDPVQKQFAHTAVLILCTPDGHISRYLYGVQFPARTLRLSLVEASQGKVTSTSDQFLLMCYHYDPKTGRYALAAMSIMRAGGALTAVILFGVIVTLLRREFRRRRIVASRGFEPRT
jgi:protein SCO1